MRERERIWQTYSEPVPVDKPCPAPLEPRPTPLEPRPAPPEPRPVLLEPRPLCEVVVSWRGLTSTRGSTPEAPCSDSALPNMERWRRKSDNVRWGKEQTHVVAAPAGDASLVMSQASITAYALGAARAAIAGCASARRIIVAASTSSVTVAGGRGVCVVISGVVVILVEMPMGEWR